MILTEFATVWQGFQLGLTDKRGLSLDPISDTDKRRRLCQAFLVLIDRRSLSGLTFGQHPGFYGVSLAVIAVLSLSLSPVDRLASAFLDGEAIEPTERELSLLNAWIDAQFKRIPVLVRFTGTDVDLPTMAANFETTGELLISVANNFHPFLEGFQNAKFRAVHDWHHLVVGADSTLKGEVATFKHAAMHAPKEMRWMLFSEIVLQAATAISTGEFAAQKLVRIPGL